MNQSNTHIVISRWQEDVNWVTPLVESGFRVSVYDHERKPNNPYYVPLNQGNEASAYLKYIIDYYNNLTTYTIFLQGTDTAWHHKGSLSKRIMSMAKKSNSKKPIKYYNFNHICLGNIGNPIFHHTKSFFDKFLKPYIGDRKLFGDWTPGNRCCAQFITHKSQIKKYPIKFYKDIYNWMMSSHDMNSREKGHMLEWTWFLIFDNPNPKRDPNHPNSAERKRAVQLGVHAGC